MDSDSMDSDVVAREPLPTSVEQMNRVSMKLAIVKYVSTFIWATLLIIALYVAYRLWGNLWLIPMAVVALWGLWELVLVRIQVRNMGWLETADELVLSEGKLWRTITVIPYGRIQFVDVSSGPLGRALDLKGLKINTASSSSNSILPGIPAAEADALRDRLADKARERMSGL